MVRGFFPLDEELALLPWSLSPVLAEHVVHLGVWMPFAVAATMLERFHRVRVPEASARRRTEEAGAAYVQVQTDQVEALEKETDEAATVAGPAVQFLSVDGANVPLLKEEWAEVKTLVIGTVGEPVWRKGELEIHSHELSYFSRLADHETFGRLASVETARRGTETAGQVAAVVDGAEWEQGFIDLHRTDAVRILDWGHASEYVITIGQAAYGSGTAALSEWAGKWLHELKHGDSEQVMVELRRLVERGRREDGAVWSAEVAKEAAGSLAYLDKRRDQIRYADFLARGFPIGSGAVESGNKLVVEARLKGAGMHWERAHVSPMVALRNLVCSDRWDEGWEQIVGHLRQEARTRSAQRRRARHEARQKAVDLTLAPASLPTTPHPTLPKPPVVPPSPLTASTQPRPPVRRPAPNHPWRHSPIGHVHSARACPQANAKL